MIDNSKYIYYILEPIIVICSSHSGSHSQAKKSKLKNKVQYTMKKIYLDTKCVITIRQSRAIEGDIYIHAVKLLFMKYYKQVL
jgi:Trm5-related predicted tRNA methylase